MENSERAINAMVEWLCDKNELGREPSEIEVADVFDYEKAHYYIMKFKTKKLDKWRVGVCGFDEEGKNTANTYSEYEDYKEATAKDKCIEMLKYLESFRRNRWLSELERRGVTEEEYAKMSKEEWEQKGEEADKREKQNEYNNRHGFILLDSPYFNFKKLKKDIKKDWGQTIEEDVTNDARLVFTRGNILIVIQLLPEPIPNHEAEYYASSNYMWKEAVKVSARHTAVLMITTFNRGNDPIEASVYFSEVIHSCLYQRNVLGVYTTGTVFEPQFYQQVAGLMKKQVLPIPIWIYVGLTSGEKEGCNCAYTYGLKDFGKTEIEIIDSKRGFVELRDFLYYFSEDIITHNIQYQDGEVVNFSGNEHIKITKSEGVNLDGETLKIHY